MGFFNKRKNPESPSSVLSESEIQKKLYGEFSGGAAHVVTGDREPFREPAPFSVPPAEPASEKETGKDLFSAQNDVLIDPDLPPRRIIPESKSEDLGPRYVPLHDFEKNTASKDALPSGADPYARFRTQQPPKKRMAALWDVWEDFSGKGAELFRALLDPKQVAVRRAFYWGLAILLVFFLFWGVNALNSQREEAMRTRYKISGESAPAKSVVPEAEGVPAGSLAERHVVITPAPVRPAKTGVSEPGRASAVPSGGAYVIQVVTYPTRKDADQVVDTFTRAGVRAFVKEDTRPSGRVYYLVLIGGFRTAADAQAQLSKFRAQEVAKPFQDAFVKTNRS
jgi:cell division septation protein DedD